MKEGPLSIQSSGASSQQRLLALLAVIFLGFQILYGIIVLLIVIMRIIIAIVIVSFVIKGARHVSKETQFESIGASSTSTSGAVDS